MSGETIGNCMLLIIFIPLVIGIPVYFGYCEGYRDGQLDYHKGTIKYTFTNEVVVVEK